MRLGLDLASPWNSRALWAMIPWRGQISGSDRFFIKTNVSPEIWPLHVPVNFEIKGSPTFAAPQCSDHRLYFAAIVLNQALKADDVR